MLGCLAQWRDTRDGEVCIRLKKLSPFRLLSAVLCALARGSGSHGERLGRGAWLMVSGG